MRIVFHGFLTVVGLMGMGSMALGQLQLTTAGSAGSFASTLGGLSGLTGAGGDQFFAVSDNSVSVLPLTININPANGQIVGGVTAGAPVVLAPDAGATDGEGIAFAGGGEGLVSFESNATVQRFNLSTGAHVSNLTVPGVFTANSNYGLESLTRAADGTIWTANEEGMAADGGRSTLSNGSVVRLQRFDPTGTPNGQWAYKTEKISGVFIPQAGLERSGVSDLMVTPWGDLLVLERELGAAGIRIRIYAVDLTAATDTTGVAIDSTVSLVGKGAPLWEAYTGLTNYEGMALGSALDGGKYSVLLINDNQVNPGGTSTTNILPLVLVPEPSSAMILAPAFFLLRQRSRR